MRVEILQEAEEELTEAIAYYLPRVHLLLYLERHDLDFGRGPCSEAT